MHYGDNLESLGKNISDEHRMQLLVQYYIFVILGIDQTNGPMFFLQYSVG